MNIILLKPEELHLAYHDERAEHIRKVLHMNVGDSVRVGIINGMEGSAKILSMDKEGIDLAFTPTEDGSVLYPLTLIIAQVRPICMKRILREAVSLGVQKLVLPVSDLGEKSYLNSSLYTEGEYKEILIDGAMQAGHTGVSDCVLTSTLEDAIAEAGDGVKLLLDNVIGAKPLSTLDLVGKKVILAIGPERGWSERERKLFVEHGFAPCLLGSRILRTETAASAGAAVALSRMNLL